MARLLKPADRKHLLAAADLVDPPQRRWRRDPVAWATERAGLELWSKQREVLWSLANNANTAVHSCHSAGKSFVSAIAACWWIDTRPPGSARVVTTAPTAPQVDAILWYEINKLHAKLGLVGRCNIREWYLGNQLVALGRKPPDNKGAAFQGLHAKHLLVIYDEAYGIPESLWNEGSSMASNEHARQLAIGNPDGPGVFQKACQPGSGWNTVHISYEHSPAYTGEKVSADLAQNLISRRWVEERRDQWGDDSALFASKCAGMFPEGGDTFSVISLDWLRGCRNLEFPEGDPVEAGIDVGAGGDRTVIRERRGRRAGRELVFVDADPMRTVGKLVRVINDWGIARVKIDATGIGHGLAGRLRELSSRHSAHGKAAHGAEVVAVNFASAPSASASRLYLNLRAELYWGVGRENSRLGLWDLTSVDDDVLRELAVSRYEIMDSQGKIKIEPKEHVIKRLGMSPDRAEALLLAFYERGRAAGGISPAFSAAARGRDSRMAPT